MNDGADPSQLLGAHPILAAEATLRKVAARRASALAAPAKSVLVRERGLAGDKAQLAAKQARAARSTLAKLGGEPPLTHARGAATSLQQALAPRAAAMHRLAAEKSAAAKLTAAPLKSALVREKSLASKGVGDARAKLRGATSVAKGQSAQALARAKAVTAPMQQAAAQDRAALKKALSANRQAAMKAVAPARSVFVRDRRAAEAALTAGAPALAVLSILRRGSSRPRLRAPLPRRRP